MHKGSLTSTLAYVISYIFDDGHSNRHEVISHCGFDLHFSNAQVDVEHLFMYLLTTVEVFGY